MSASSRERKARKRRKKARQRRERAPIRIAERAIEVLERSDGYVDSGARWFATAQPIAPRKSSA